MRTLNTLYNIYYRAGYSDTNAIEILKIRPELMVEQPDPILYSRKNWYIVGYQPMALGNTTITCNARPNPVCRTHPGLSSF